MMTRSEPDVGLIRNLHRRDTIRLLVSALDRLLASNQQPDGARVRALVLDLWCEYDQLLREWPSLALERPVTRLREDVLSAIERAGQSMLLLSEESLDGRHIS